ncbi:hypothetical protein HK405_007865 [Cladochytrium tenue]|nr:hypothetical protein HK405_007865 [Cladochytrium tenue]
MSGGPSSPSATAPDHGPDDYYELLKIDRSAEPDAIKKDKNAGDPNAAERFQRIARAYEILSDPKKRQVYDQYGERGISMMDSVPFLDPDMIIMMKQTVAVLAVMSILLLVFPILISLRADGKISASWSVVFIPAYIVLGAAVVMSGLNAARPDTDDDDDASSHHRKGSRVVSVVRRSLGTVYFALILTFAVLLALRLDGRVGSWSAAFAPWFAVEAFHLALGVQIVAEKFVVGVEVPAAPPSEDDDEAPAYVNRPMTGTEKLVELVSQFVPWALRLVQAILVVVKLQNDDFAPWAVVFIPVFLQGAFTLGMFVPSYHSLLRSGATVSEAVTSIVASLIGTVVVLVLLYVLVGLLIARLNDGNSPSAAVVLIPVFIVLSLVFCCASICLPCAIVATNFGLEAELRGDDEENGTAANNGNGATVAENRRIEAAASASSSSAAA